MLESQDMQSKYSQAYSSVQNQGFRKKVAKHGRKNGLLDNCSKENYCH